MKIIRILSFLLCFFTSYTFAEAPLKVLHLSFHRGCINEFETIAKKLALTVDTWWIPGLPEGFFDGEARGNALYNIGHVRAERIWQLHRETFEQYDVILTSDTCPLARIFLQNGWQKPLIIWICNRFDYCDQASLDCDFPDQEYYELMNSATEMPNVAIVAYTAFEHYYARKKGIDTGTLIITPCGIPAQKVEWVSQIPNTVNKSTTFFLPPYHNETIYTDLCHLLTNLGINNYRGRYGGPCDLQDFKGIIHLPYSWSNLAFFENMNLGIPYFVPSQTFFSELAQSGNYFHPNLGLLLEEQLFPLSEWYSPYHAPVMTYFDSWEHLAQLVNTIDYGALRSAIKAHATEHQKETLKKWHTLFAGFSQFTSSSATEPDSHRR